MSGDLCFCCCLVFGVCVPFVVSVVFLFVRCWLSVVGVRCSLFGVRCSVFVVCCRSCVVSCSLFVVCCLLCVV